MGSFPGFGATMLIFTLIDKCETKVYAISDGNSVFKESFPTDGLLLMGSESHGINDELLARSKIE